MTTTGMRIITIDLLSRLPKLGRLNTIKGYPKKALRINDIGEIEMVVRGRKKKQVWAPIGYCMKGHFTEEEVEKIKDEIRNQDV